MVLELNLCYCMPLDEVGLCCAPLFPSCIFIYTRPAGENPAHQPCVGQVKNIENNQKRLSPSHAVIIVPRVIVH